MIRTLGASWISQKLQFARESVVRLAALNQMAGRQSALPSRGADAVLGVDRSDLGRVAGLEGGMQGVEVVLQSAGGDDEQPACGAADAPERVRPLAGEEHKRTRRHPELLVVAFDLQQAGEQVDALVLAGMR